MAVFNTNQVRHLYVTSVNESKVEAAQDAPVDPATLKSKPVGTIYPVVDNVTTPTKLHLVYKGVGGPIRSDLIDLKKATYFSIVDPTVDVYTLKAKKITLRADLNGGDPVAGQDYILSLEIKGFVSGFEEDTYVKHGIVHAFSNMDDKKFYNALALSLWMNFSRENTTFFTFWLGNTPMNAENAKTIKNALISGDDESLFDADGVVVQEAPMEWHLGRMQEEHLFFDISGDTVIFNGDELMWAAIEDVAPNANTQTEFGYPTTIPNSHRIADLEYFCLGERNTLYRGMDWPNSIFDPASLLVNPNSTTGYYVFNLHFAFTDSREGVQRSEKDLQIVANSTADLNNLITVLTNAGVKRLTRRTS